MLTGLLGLLANPIFRDDGILATASSDSFNMLLWNGIGGLVLMGYHLVTSAVLFLTLEKLGLFRVAPKDEITGLDAVKHQEKAYDYSKF